MSESAEPRKTYPRSITPRMRKLAELVERVRAETGLRGAGLFAYLKTLPESAGLLSPTYSTLRRVIADVRAVARGVKLRAVAKSKKPNAAMRKTHALAEEVRARHPELTTEGQVFQWMQSQPEYRGRIPQAESTFRRHVWLVRRQDGLPSGLELYRSAMLANRAAALPPENPELMTDRDALLFLDFLLRRRSAAGAVAQ